MTKEEVAKRIECLRIAQALKVGRLPTSYSTCLFYRRRLLATLQTTEAREFARTMRAAENAAHGAAVSRLAEVYEALAGLIHEENRDEAAREPRVIAAKWVTLGQVLLSAEKADKEW